jgi:tRNA nucleotidyltransferase (CCA-adding enzyme)
MNDFNGFVLYCLSELLKLVNGKLYLVGGFVREKLLGGYSADYDFVLPENTITVAKGLAKKTGGAFVLLDEQRNTARVVWNRERNNWDLNFDFATIMGSSIINDLTIRDLTINSLAIEIIQGTIEKLVPGGNPLLSEELIDPAEGFADLEKKQIRTLSRENLVADPLRILRVFRFAAKLGFEISGKTLDYVKSIPELILLPARERVLKELYDIFSSEQSFKQFKTMNDVYLLTYLFQGLGNFNKDTFSRAINNLELLEILVSELPEHFIFFQEIDHYLNRFTIQGHRKFPLLKIVLVLIALKPENSSTDEYLPGVEKFLKFYTFSFIEQQLILKHLKFGFSFQEIKDFNFSRKNLFHFFKDRQEEVPGSLLINYVLSWSEIAIRENIKKISNFYFEDEILSNQPQLINGNDLIRDFKLKPGRLIGQLLNSVREAQAEKKINSRLEALDFVSEILKKG